MGVPTTPEDHEDLSEYKFAKFAATYFQVREDVKMEWPVRGQCPIGIKGKCKPD